MCGLQMHPTKTKIVYCKDNRRKGDYPNVTFDFLGYQFRPRRVANSQRTKVFCRVHPSGQSRSAQVHSGDDQELEHSPADAGDAG